MINIYSFLEPERILINPAAADKKSLIRQFAESIAASGVEVDKDLLLSDVLARETLSSTGLEYGCAIPHAHSAALDRTVVAAALLKDGLDFSTPDGQPARIIFLIAGPKGNAGHHLKLISKLARILHDPQFRDRLVAAGTREDVLGLIQEREE